MAYDTLMNTPDEQPRPLEDKFDVAGRKVGNDLRDLDGRQLIFAEKLINDVIYYAKLGSLNEGSSVNPSNALHAPLSVHSTYVTPATNTTVPVAQPVQASYMVPHQRVHYNMESNQFLAFGETFQKHNSVANNEPELSELSTFTRKQ